MSLLTRVRTRLSGFYHHQTADVDANVDPHEWRLPTPSSSSLFRRRRHNRNCNREKSESSAASSSSSSSSSSDSSDSDDDDDDDVDAAGRKKKKKGRGVVVPDPEIFRNAFVPVFAGNPARAVTVADGRLTYPDASHVAVHLALLECFAALRRGVMNQREGGLPPIIDDHEEDEDDDAGDHEKRSSSSSIEGDDTESDDSDDDDDDDADSSSQKRQRQKERQKRWDLFVRHAVVRFGAWWANIDKLLDHATAYTPSYHHHPQPQAQLPPSHSRDGSEATLTETMEDAATAAAETAPVVVVQLTSDYLPPLDVLLVWYAFMLTPASTPEPQTNISAAADTTSTSTPSSPSPSLSPYDKACRAHPHPALRNLCFPWPAIRDIIDFSTSTSPTSTSPSTGAEYRLPRAAAILFRTISGQSAETLRPKALETSTPPPSAGGRDQAAEGIGIDLVATIHTLVDPFVARAANLDWLHGPPRTLVGALERAGVAYQGFLLRGGGDGGGVDEGHLEEGWDRDAVAADDDDDGNKGKQFGGDKDEEEGGDGGVAGGPESEGGRDEEKGGNQKDIRQLKLKQKGKQQPQLPFGISLMWRTHRLFPSQYRLFFHQGSEGEGEGKDSDALAAFRWRMALGGLGLGPSATGSGEWKASIDDNDGDSDNDDSSNSKDNSGGRGGEETCTGICECWICERIRDEAPTFAYYGKPGSGSGSGPASYDAGLLRALSTEQMRSIQEDLGFYYALREARTGRRHGNHGPTHNHRRRRRRWRRGSDSSEGSESHVLSRDGAPPTPRTQQRISAGRIFSKGIKALEDRRRSWRMD